MGFFAVLTASLFAVFLFTVFGGDKTQKSDASLLARGFSSLGPGGICVVSDIIRKLV